MKNVKPWHRLLNFWHSQCKVSHLDLVICSQMDALYPRHDQLRKGSCLNQLVLSSIFLLKRANLGGVFFSSCEDIFCFKVSSPRHSSHPRIRPVLVSQKCPEDLMQLCSIKVKVRSRLLESSPSASMEQRSDSMYLLTIIGLFSQMLIFITLLKHTKCWS